MVLSDYTSVVMRFMVYEPAKLYFFQGRFEPVRR